MGRMKDLKFKLTEAYPQHCPRCERFLGDDIDWNAIDRVIDEICQIATVNAGRGIKDAKELQRPDRPNNEIEKGRQNEISMER